MAHILRLSRPVLCALFLIAPISGCTTWTTEPVAPAQLLQDKHPKSVRVVRTDGSRVTIFTPRIAGDSLVGTDFGRNAEFGWFEELHVGVALADIREIATTRPSAGKELGLVLLTGALLVGVIFVVAAGAAASGPS